MPAERLYIAVLEYFLDEEGKKVILDDFISFFNKEYNVFTEILFESTVKGLAGMVGLSKKLVSNKGYRNKVEQYLRLVDVGIKRLDVQTETIFDERTGKKRKKKLFVPYTIFMMKQEMWLEKNFLICIRNLQAHFAFWHIFKMPLK